MCEFIIWHIIIIERFDSFDIEFTEARRAICIFLFFFAFAFECTMCTWYGYHSEYFKKLHKTHAKSQPNLNL